jgi:CDP-paratose 2-epimerase
MEKYVLITGSLGLVGSESVNFFLRKKFKVLGIDNNKRKFFFGKEGSVKLKTKSFKSNPNYKHYNIDILDFKKVNSIFKKFNSKIKLIIHAAAQPSHDWAYKNPILDFDINARSTLHLLECFKKYSSKSTFIFTSTNKVYGDLINTHKLDEKKTRFEINKKNYFYKRGVTEEFSIDKSTHSFFGNSKVSADLYVQEFGRNFNLKTGVFRCGCITGENHAGTEAHGFLNYLTKQVMTKKSYKIIGYKGKQVRDNIHSYDLVNAFWLYFLKPRKGEVYNLGGGRNNSCSIIEVIDFLEEKFKIKVKKQFINKERSGDHIWWITDNRKFINHYPKWKIQFSLTKILTKLCQSYI